MGEGAAVIGLRWIGRSAGDNQQMGQSEFEIENRESSRPLPDSNQVSIVTGASLPETNFSAGVCFPSPNSSIILFTNAGMSSGLRLVTSPLSTTTSSSIQCAPAFFRSV